MQAAPRDQLVLCSVFCPYSFCCRCLPYYPLLSLVLALMHTTPPNSSSVRNSLFLSSPPFKYKRIRVSIISRIESLLSVGSSPSSSAYLTTTSQRLHCSSHTGCRAQLLQCSPCSLGWEELLFRLFVLMLSGIHSYRSTFINLLVSLACRRARAPKTSLLKQKELCI